MGKKGKKTTFKPIPDELRGDPSKNAALSKASEENSGYNNSSKYRTNRDSGFGQRNEEGRFNQRGPPREASDSDSNTCWRVSTGGSEPYRPSSQGETAWRGRDSTMGNSFSNRSAPRSNNDDSDMWRRNSQRQGYSENRNDTQNDTIGGNEEAGNSAQGEHKSNENSNSATNDSSENQQPGRNVQSYSEPQQQNNSNKYIPPGQRNRQGYGQNTERMSNNKRWQNEGEERDQNNRSFSDRRRGPGSDAYSDHDQSYNRGRDSQASNRSYKGRDSAGTGTYSDQDQSYNRGRDSQASNKSFQGRDSLGKGGYGRNVFNTSNPTKEQEAFISYLSSKDSNNFIKVKEEEQDLFEVGEDYALAHCVAEDMNMGSGIAIEFRSRFKKVAELLDQNASSGGLALLNIKGRFIYYLVTKRISQGKPSYDSLWASLLKLRTHMQDNKVSKLALPRIGCGLDRLNWDTVKPMLEFLFQNDDVHILVCNHQPDAANTKIVKKCKVVFEAKPVTEIAPETVVIYFASADGTATEAMKILDQKFKYFTQFEKSNKVLGEVVRCVPMFAKSYVLYGCIVKNKQDDPISFVHFASCLHKIAKNYNVDNFYYIAFQSLEDDLLNAKILNLMKHTLKEMDVYICGSSPETTEE